MSSSILSPKFENIDTVQGLKTLDQYLLHNSYIQGYQPTELDFQLYSKFTSVPSTYYKSVWRWYKHISSYPEAHRFTWAECDSTQKDSCQTTNKPKAAAPAKKDESDDDFDPFADETPEEAMAAQKVTQKATEVKKKEKAPVIDKSQIVLFVKPISIKTDLDALEKMIKEIKIEGLQWSVSTKKVPIAYGLMKLQIGCNIIDSLVQTDDIISAIECLGLTEEQKAKKLEAIENGEEYYEEDDDEEPIGLVSSVEIASFNKL